MVLSKTRERTNVPRIAACLLALFGLTCFLVLYFLGLVWSTLHRPTDACQQSLTTHRALVHSILKSNNLFRSTKSNPTSPAASQKRLLLDLPRLSSDILTQHANTRYIASRFLSSFCACRSMTPSKPANLLTRFLGLYRPRVVYPALSLSDRAAIETEHFARYPVDGVIQYIFGVLGTRSKIAIELDAASGSANFFGVGSLVLYDGWDALVLHSVWSGYNRAQQFYESSDPQGAFAWRKRHFPDSRVVIGEEHVHAGTVDDAIRNQGFAGRVDLAFLLLDGAEWSVWDKLSIIRPRVVVCFYEDFWGSDLAVVRKWNASSPESSSPGEFDGVDFGRKRLFAGASLSALISRGQVLGYRLVWCLKSSPVAIFLQDVEDPDRIVLPLLSAESCISSRQSTMWRRDMEAQWCRAQQFEWETI